MDHLDDHYGKFYQGMTQEVEMLTLAGTSKKILNDIGAVGNSSDDLVREWSQNGEGN